MSWATMFASVASAWNKADLLLKAQYVATAITLAVGVKGFMEAKALMAKGQDILGQKTSQGGKIPVIYGRRRVGSTVVFMNTANNRSKDLLVVYALSVGEIDQIELDTIEINGVSIKDPIVFRQGYYAGSDKIASGAGSLCTFDQRGTVTAENAGGSGTDPAQRYRMVFNAHHGADDQAADPMLIASSGGQWTSSHRVRGIAYLACSYEYDTKGMFSSIPQLTVVCRGKKLYDPRKDGSITGGTGSHRYNTPSTFEWSDNAALCLLDYMRDNQYGKGLAETDINLQTFQSTATTAETKQDTPDYDGSYAASTFSGDAGTGVIIVDEDTWKTAKIGANLNLKDNAGNVEFVDNQIVDATRYQPFDENAIYQVIVRNALANTYTNEAGQALVKVERFSCNGVIDANKNILENTQELLANMRGILNYIDGKYEITLEDTASSTFTVTDDHIIGDSGITVTYEDKAQKANKVVVQFFNALKKYEMDTATVLHDASPNFTSDDGGEELELVIEFPHIVNKYVAYNMGKAILGRSRSQMTIAFTGTPELYKTKVGDVITVVYTPVGFTGKLFRIESMTLQPDGLVGVQAIEYLDIYTWQAPPQEIIEPINNPVAYFAVKAPTGITFTDAGSSSTGRSFLTWNEPTDYPNHQYRIRIVDSSSNKLTNKIVDQEFVDLNYLPVGSNYVASVSAINSINEESSAATLTFSVSTPPVATADIKNSAISTSKIIAHAISLLNPMSATGNVYRYGGYNDIGTVVNAIPSGIALSYNSAENALSIVSDANTSISSDSFEVDHNSIYKLSFQIKKTTTGGGWYVGAKQFTSFTSGQSLDGSNNQTSINFGVYGSDRTAGTDTPNAYFASKTVTDTNYSEVVCYLIGSQVNLDEVPNHSYSAGISGTPYIRLDSTATQAGIRILNWSNDTTTRTVLVKNLTMAQMTANTIVAENISVTNLAAINADLGNITAGSLDINSAFTVSSAGAMTATGAVISGAITATSGSFTGSLNSASGTFTGALSGGTISIGSGNSIFKADANGIYLGHATFASAPFSVTPAGALSAQSATLSGTIKSNQSFTSGSSTRTVKIDASTNSTYTLTAGADNPTNAPFRIKSDGTVEITKLKLYLDDGVTEIFDSATGFTVNAFSGIVQDLGASIQSYSKTISSNTDAQKITLTASQSITVKAIKSARIFGWSQISPFDALGQIPSNVRMRLMHSTNANLSSPTELAVLGSTWTGGVSRIATGTPTNVEFAVLATLESEPEFTFYEYETLNQSGDAIADDFTFTISNTATYTGSTNGTDHYFFIEVAGTGGTTQGSGNISATATRSLNISGTSFYISDGTASNIGEGDITAVYAGTNLNGGGTAGAVTLNLNSTISGDHTFSNNVVIGGNLDVQGTTTTIDTANLDVKDKNITLNYGTGDTSALSDGAGITIQDAVNSTTNATILWDKPNSRFTTSHGLGVGGVLTATGGTMTGALNVTNSSSITIGTLSTTDTGSLVLTGSTANKQSVLKCTNGNLHIDAASGNTMYLNFYSGTGVAFGNGATGAVAWMGSDGDLWKGGSDNAGSKYWNAGDFANNSTNWNTAYTYSQTDADVLRKRTDIPNAANLNTYTAIGLYHQNSNAQAAAGSNYPLGVAGMLTVTEDGVMIYQTYQGYASNGTYERKYYNGTWESWHLVYDSGVFTNNSTNWNTAYTVANAALPKAGGTMTGTLAMGANAITSTGTISSNAVGIGTATVDSGYLLHLKSTGDAAILIEADTDNVTETDNAFIRFKQDGGAVAARVGYADNVFEIMNEYNDSLILGQANTPRLTLTSASATFAGTISATGGNSTNWNTAYGWGNHASANYIVKGTQIASGASWTTATRFGSVGEISQAAGNHALSVRSELGNDAFMSFHIGSDYAVHFGLDGASNRLYVGGWSDGTGIQYQMYDSRDGSAANWNTAYTVANAALPKAGGALTGAVTTNSTFDGRDVATDGATLDQIKTGGTLATYGTTAGASGRIRCTAPFNTNSGLMFQVTVSLYGSYTCHTYVVSGYMYSTTNQWYESKAIYTGTGSPDIVVGRDSSGKAYISIANGSYMGVRVHNMTRGYQTTVADTSNPWTITVNAATENSVTPTISKVWHSTNDGSGSGLDADLLDGNQATAFATAAQGTLATNALPKAGGTMTGTLAMGANAITSTGTISSGVITTTGIRTGTGQARVKLGVWSDTTYGIGMQSGYSFGGLINEYAMTFQMSNTAARGFWWGDSTHTNAQGAMALTTTGLLTVASGIRVGYGEADTTSPTTGLAVNGAISSGAITSSGTVTASSLVKTGGTAAQFLKANGSVQSSTASSPQGTTSPFNATNNTLTFLINVAHLNGLVTGSQTGVLNLSTGELQITTQGEINIKANSITAAKIAANTITGTQINTDLLNVKSFDNVSSTIVSHVTAGTKFPLARDGQAYVQRSAAYTGSNASFVPVTITQVRDNAGYVAIFSGVLGNVSGGRVQYSLNNSTWVDANGNTNIYWNAGTYRGYTYVYTGQITTLSASQSTVYWRVYFSGGYNHTQLSLNVMMDNTR